MWPRISPKELIRGLSCMHKGREGIEILWDHQTKNSFVEIYKDCTICAILRENTPICLEGTEAKTCFAMLRRGRIVMQIPRQVAS